MAGKMTRRALVGGGALAVVGAGAVASGAAPGRTWLHAELRDRSHEWFSPQPHIPSAPEGEIRLEQVRSRARGKTVDLFTAVPHGHGDGAGLPVCVILHGVSATPKDYQAFGLGRFLTAAVQRGAPPFVLAGADGGTGAEDGQLRSRIGRYFPVWQVSQPNENGAGESSQDLCYPKKANVRPVSR